jgi:hypothetical protein
MHRGTSENLLLVNAGAVETELTTRKLGFWQYKSVLATLTSNETIFPDDALLVGIRQI